MAVAWKQVLSGEGWQAEQQARPSFFTDPEVIRAWDRSKPCSARQ